MGKILKNGTEYGLGGKELIDRIYPVGSIYISTSASFNPQTAWGGTWRKTADGRCLIGANDTYPLGSTGGEATHTLSTNEIPSHSHGLLGYIFNQAYAQSIPKYGLLCSAQMAQKGWDEKGDYCDFDGLKHDGAVNSWSIRANGGGASHNNMQPYLAVYIWERTA